MIVKIKVSANVKYELSNFGMIKAKTMLKALFKNEHITKKWNNVTESIENLLYDGREVEKAYYDALTNQVELHLSETIFNNKDYLLDEYCCDCGGQLYKDYTCSKCGQFIEIR